MKDGVNIINTGRGKVLDEEALLEALDSGKVGSIALDVLADEYPDLNNSPFVGRTDVIITPHSAFYSKSSLLEGRIETAKNILNFFNGEYDKCNIVNGTEH